jgi:uncharacterized membrane protein YphA (DoxX/SURF4 family)
MNVALWILQVLLAVLFLLHGYLYVVWPPAMVEQMRQRSPNPQQDVLGISPGFRRFIGVAEWLAAVGLIAPGLSGILPWLTPLAAFGLMIVTGGAVVHHLRRGETQMVIPTAILFLLVTVVAYMRWQVVPL